MNHLGTTISNYRQDVHEVIAAAFLTIDKYLKDAYAIMRLNALQIETAPLADLFESLDELAPELNALPKWMTDGFSYISSHPPTPERADAFRNNPGR